MLDLFIEAYLISVTAIIYSEVLTDNGMILERLYVLLDKLPDWLFKPLIGCVKCVSGQIACWYFIFNHEYSLISHIAFMSFVIWLTIFNFGFYNKLIK